jgi:hypothetical protein
MKNFDFFRWEDFDFEVAASGTSSLKSLIFKTWWERDFWVRVLEVIWVRKGKCAEGGME